MKDITNGVSLVISLILVICTWQLNIDENPETPSQSDIPHYVYNGTQEIKQKDNKTSIKRKSKKNHNEAAIHEAAHFVVYMELCKRHGITPNPIELSIISDEMRKGHFRYSSKNISQEMNILTYLAGYDMNEHMGQKSHFELMEGHATQEGSDIYKVLEIVSSSQLESYYQQALNLVQALEPQIQAVSVRLEKEKIIYF